MPNVESTTISTLARGGALSEEGGGPAERGWLPSNAMTANGTALARRLDPMITGGSPQCWPSSIGENVLPHPIRWYLGLPRIPSVRLVPVLLLRLILLLLPVLLRHLLV